MTPARRWRIGITCYPSLGGSGVVATEIGMELARRGHQVHFISTNPPWRLDATQENVHFHRVEPSSYPLFNDGQYALALASRMVGVAQEGELDVFHVHYAIPHAAAAYLARQMLGPRSPRVVTTLHGTDITVVGQTPSFLPVTRFSILQSDAVTAPSKYLARATQELLGAGAAKPIEVIPNFVDTERYRPAGVTARRLRVVHNSNFRPLKRLLDVIRVFARVRAERECELVLIGDGPDRPAAEEQVRRLGLSDSVTFLGRQMQLVETLQSARVFLLPSEAEAFGLAALEAMSCGVPVVATQVGGLPEVVQDAGELLPVGDVTGMAAAVSRLLADEGWHRRLSARARDIATGDFPRERVIDAYLATYARVVAAG